LLNKIKNEDDLIKDLKEKNKKITKSKATKKPLLTMDESWKLIGTRKNTDAEKVKLREVYNAMEKGIIGRDVNDYNKNFSKTEALKIHSRLLKLKRKDRLNEIVLTTPVNYYLAQNEAQLQEMYEIVKKELVIAIDTETTGLNVYKDVIVGYSITAPIADKHWYVPLRHELEQGINVNCDMHSGLWFLELICQLPCDKVFHNAVFDLHILHFSGIMEVRGKVHCTSVIAHILNENEPSYKLKDLAPKYLKFEADLYSELFGANGKFAEVELKYALHYACKDTHLTYKLYEFYLKHLNGTGLINYYLKVEQPLLQVIARMEREGFCVDLDEVRKQESEIKIKLKDMENELYGTLGEINLNSPVQLKNALNNIGAKVSGTSAEVLKNYEDDFPIIKLLLEYKTLFKFLTGFVEKVEDFIQSDGKIHPNYNQAGTVTGRLSSSKPNFQQQSKKARLMYKTDDESLIAGLDFSKICGEVKPL